MGGYTQGTRSVKVIIWITIGKTLDLLYFIHRREKRGSASPAIGIKTARYAVLAKLRRRLLVRYG